MSAKKDFNRISRHGTSPLFKAVEDGDYAKVRVMLDAGADIDLQSTERTAWSSMTRDMAYAKGSTVLHVACLMGDRMMVSLLLSKGAKISVKNSENKTPLDYALQSLSYYTEKYQRKKNSKLASRKSADKAATMIGVYERIVETMTAKGGRPALYSLPPKFTLGK